MNFIACCSCLPLLVIWWRSQTQQRESHGSQQPKWVNPYLLKWLMQYNSDKQCLNLKGVKDMSAHSQIIRNWIMNLLYRHTSNQVSRWYPKDYKKQTKKQHKTKQHTSVHLNIVTGNILSALMTHSKATSPALSPICVCVGEGDARVRAVQQLSLLRPFPPLTPPLTSCLSINQHHGYITAAKAPSYISSGQRPYRNRLLMFVSICPNTKHCICGFFP